MIKGTEHWKDGIRIYLDSNKKEVTKDDYTLANDVLFINIECYKFTDYKTNKSYYEFVDTFHSNVVRKDEQGNVYYMPLRNLTNKYKMERDFTGINLDILDGI